MLYDVVLGSQIAGGAMSKHVDEASMISFVQQGMMIPALHRLSIIIASEQQQ